MIMKKVSNRSKVIRKKEKTANANLKSKAIFLERDNFDLIPVI